jgi:hypothetical protein
MSLVPSHQAPGANAQAVYPGRRDRVGAPYPGATRSTLAARPIARPSTGYSALAAAATFTTLPLMVFFLLLQRQFSCGAPSAAGSSR